MDGPHVWFCHIPQVAEKYNESQAELTELLLTLRRDYVPPGLNHDIYKCVRRRTCAVLVLPPVGGHVGAPPLIHSWCIQQL